MKKVNVYLTVGALEAIASGRGLWSWHYAVAEEGSDGPKGGRLIGEVVFELPGKEECVGPVLEALDAQVVEARQDLNNTLAEIEERRAHLLCLTAG